MAMRIPRTQYEWDRPAAGITEKVFDRGQDLWEGINGRAGMNTKFENTERLQVMDPRGDHAGRPMPRDGESYPFDNHGEWGPDHYIESLDCGIQGPLEQRPYYGRGLPKEKCLSPNANPAFGNADCMVEPEKVPGDQGIGSKTP